MTLFDLAMTTVNTNETTKKAYDFEVEALETLSTDRNPYIQEIRQMTGAWLVWEALNCKIDVMYL